MMATGKSLIMRAIRPKVRDAGMSGPNPHRRAARAVAREHLVSVRRVKRAVKRGKIVGDPLAFPVVTADQPSQIDVT